MSSMEAPKEEGKQLLIIGGGIAGLSAGIYARQNGYRATILEMGEHAGGQLTAWQRQGYTFDFCLQWLVGSRRGTFHEIFREIGALAPSVEIVHHDVFLKLVHESYGDFLFYADVDKWEAYLKELAPEDAKGIHRLCSMIRKAAKVDGLENPPGLRSFWEYLSLVIKHPRFLPIMGKYLKRSNRELVDDLGLKNKKLRYFLIEFGSPDQPGHGDMPALVMLMLLGWLHDKNAGYLKGGSKQMSQRVADMYAKMGGEFRFSTRVKEILVENNVARGVILENGERILADYVISACDGHTVLYDMLGGKYLPPIFKKAYEEWQTFTPWVMVGFGIDKPIVSECHETVYAAKEKMQIGRTSVASYTIMNRSMYDETFAPEGKTALQMFFESPWDIWSDLNDDEYAQEKECIKKRCITLLEEHYPGISDHIEVINLATPLTETRYTGVWRGAFEGFEPSVGTLGTELPMELEGLSNFWMVGQWVMHGGGLPPSAQSGRWVIQKLAKKDQKRFKHYVPA